VSEADPGGSTSGGGDGLSVQDFIDEQKFSFTIKWGALFSAVGGGVVLAGFQTIIGTIQSLSLAFRTVSSAATDRITRVIEAVFSVTGIMDEAWAAAAADLAGTGIFAFVLSVAVVGASSSIYSLVVSWLVD